MRFVGITISVAFAFCVAGVVAGFIALYPSKRVMPPKAEVHVVKADRVDASPINDDEPKTVRTIPIAPQSIAAWPAPVLTPSPPSETAQQEEPKTKTRTVSAGTSNICTRHGGYRVDSGRSWHCAYPKRKDR